MEEKHLATFSRELYDSDVYMMSTEDAEGDLNKLYAPNTTVFIVADPMTPDTQQDPDVRVVAQLYRLKVAASTPRPRCVVLVLRHETCGIIRSMNILDADDRLGCREWTSTEGGTEFD